MKNFASMTCLLVLIGVVYCDARDITLSYLIGPGAEAAYKAMTRFNHCASLSRDCFRACQMTVDRYMVDGVLQVNNLKKKWPVNRDGSINEAKLRIVEECVSIANGRGNSCVVAEEYDNCKMNKIDELLEGVTDVRILRDWI